PHSRRRERTGRARRVLSHHPNFRRDGGCKNRGSLPAGHVRSRIGAAMRVGRIPYINCYPVYGAIDRGIVPMSAELIDGVPTALNHEMKVGTLDVSVISAVEYARDATKYLLLPDLSICSDGPVRSVVLFSKRPASDLQGRRVLVSRSSMTRVAPLVLFFG